MEISFDTQTQQSEYCLNNTSYFPPNLRAEDLTTRLINV